ncbi:TetR/AcrR family transcriptional regulator [Acinetobacter bouvetii]|uniref:HTH-type transcriptional repressor NicS n=1 Tax=Acinetobacter bouvetii TaxID=202951 RepID=A0A811GH19_9GAMM|nr:TetR/AcrR family transcriptional regulator [Acinetobacter bouvetii]CAB1221624.1 HTH-type transcriptional repressor NicS [Acinetobacter bouvetii]
MSNKTIASSSKNRSSSEISNRDNILRVALLEFAEKGVSGVRVEHLAKAAQTNIRMIYHYFKSKEQLYVEVLEYTVNELRRSELQLNLDIGTIDPIQGILKLYDFTEEHFSTHRELFRILQFENLNNAENIQKSSAIPLISSHLLHYIEILLHRGVEMRLIKQGIDPLHLYTMIVSLIVFPKSNALTMSFMFKTDLVDGNWQQQHKNMCRQMLESFIKA